MRYKFIAQTTHLFHSRSRRPGPALRPVQEGRLPLRQVALRAEDRPQHSLVPGHLGERERARALRVHLPEPAHRAHCGARGVA
ncbi:hypothetical protein O3G_MSEX001109 [Manduca sexta]|nr:hypothetical protein O3G_MSEX001109 [Manduca sexta]